jgi:hypothetical protein
MRSADIILLRQPSTHLAREKRSKDKALDDILHQWGDHRNMQLPGLSLLKRHTHVLTDPTKPKTTLSWPAKGKETRIFTAIIPDYWPSARLRDVSRVMDDIDIKTRDLIIRRYQYKWEQREFCQFYNWKPPTYWARISEARRVIRCHPLIRQLLGRG